MLNLETDRRRNVSLRCADPDARVAVGRISARQDCYRQCEEVHLHTCYGSISPHNPGRDRRGEGVIFIAGRNSL